ncbi:2-oxo acid dehydrogenase subunit E2 [Streptomyces sp. A7024]|uniref:Dihydrolipoamide acetyltransferase component of pyruvate dehydrogenase complex n=1 Tax=Streptomyces coryli TaxID=1128680 RepID=A0A6G4U014_9ACTN|nr:dihydrolipoamide acetyltransferase family protein [Streptomyces coryli]NGN65423.1 2-oxo acid dehydrogenase subunit E2 [Streptomyces coryli]
MAEVREFALPDLGEGLTEAEIIRWLVSAGDAVAVDQVVVEVETAKAAVEVPCPYAGVVTATHGEPGTEVPVGAPLVSVAVAGDGPVGSSGSAAGAAAVAAAEDEGSGNVLVGYGTSAPAGRRRRRNGAAMPGVRAGGEASGVDAPPRPVTPVRDAGADRSGRAVGPIPVISPLVRRLAREHGLDLAAMVGSGPGGLILRADVERAVSAAAEQVGHVRHAASVPDAASVARRQPQLAEERIPLRGIRGATADKLSRSRREIPDATCWVDADATELLAARRAMNAAGGEKVSLLALLGRITTAALARHPELNATVDAEAREIVRLPAVHLGFAAQTDRGLIVPVVRDAHTLSAAQLSAELARLTEAARAGRLSPSDLTGGTFTLNNYGVFGVDGSTPILNHPEAGMLGVGRIVEKPWVHGGELAVRHVVQLSFSFDHRVCDGGTAGSFLRFVADCVEQPAVLLREL